MKLPNSLKAYSVINPPPSQQYLASLTPVLPEFLNEVVIGIRQYSLSEYHHYFPKESNLLNIGTNHTDWSTSDYFCLDLDVKNKEEQDVYFVREIEFSQTEFIWRERVYPVTELPHDIKVQLSNKINYFKREGLWM